MSSVKMYENISLLPIFEKTTKKAQSFGELSPFENLIFNWYFDGIIFFFFFFWKNNDVSLILHV